MTLHLVPLTQVAARDAVQRWVLADPVLFDDPVPARGRLGLWEWPGMTDLRRDGSQRPEET